MSPLAEKEERLRSEVANIVQKIFLLLKASNCLVPCVRWYTEQLVSTSENWYNVIRTDADFPVPSSLAGYADRGFSFRDIEADQSSHVSPKKKGECGDIFCVLHSIALLHRAKKIKVHNVLKSSAKGYQGYIRQSSPPK